MSHRTHHRERTISPPDGQALRRIRLWRAARGITQDALGRAAGHDQPWASLYLDGGVTAGLPELAGMAKLLGQSLSSLFDAGDGNRRDETELLTLYRGMTDTDKSVLLELARRLTSFTIGRGSRSGSESADMMLAGVG